MSHCMICGSRSCKSIGIQPDFYTNIFQCNSCGTTQSDYVSDHALTNYYRSHYRESRNNESINDNYLSFMKERAKGQLEFISHYCDVNDECSAVLEIGCGAGQLINQFASDKYVSEADIKFADYIRNKYPAINISDTETYLNSNNYKSFFNLILMSHVFEHLNDPVNYLTKLAAIVPEGGKIFVEIPNESPETIQKVIENNEKTGHLYFYNKSSFEKLVELQGEFDLLEIQFSGISTEDFIFNRKKLSDFSNYNDSSRIWLRAILIKCGNSGSRRFSK